MPCMNHLLHAVLVLLRRSALDLSDGLAIGWIHRGNDFTRSSPLLTVIATHIYLLESEAREEWVLIERERHVLGKCTEKLFL